jgi:hypothetical protein
MSNQPSNQPKHSSSSSPGPAAVQPSISPVAPPTAPLAAPGTLRAAFVAVCVWIFYLFNILAVLVGVLPILTGWPPLSRGYAWPVFSITTITLCATTIATFSNQSMFNRVDRGLYRFYKRLSDPKLLGLFTLMSLLSLVVSDRIARRPPPPTPTATVVASAAPSATTASSSPRPSGTTPLASATAAPEETADTAAPQPVVLCASDASTSPFDGRNSTPIPADAYTSLARYSTAPTVGALVKKLYPYTVIPLRAASCANGSQIVSTAQIEALASSNQLVFNNPERSPPGGDVWVLMSASDTAGVSSNEEIGDIQAVWSNNVSAAATPLILGRNIADWTFRGQPIPGSREEYQTVADFDGAASEVLRVWIDHEFDRTANQIGRAAQLLAVHVATVPSDTSLQSLKIRDRAKGPGLDILAVVVIPGGAPVIAAEPSISQPICLAAAGASKNWSMRNFNDDVAPDRTYYITPGCAEGGGATSSTQTALTDIAPGVEFYFNNILATEPSSHSSAGHRDSQIVLNISNAISATHVYLLMSARNLCAVKADAIGQIIVAEQAPVDLIAGNNIRQGRTNISRVGCKSSQISLNMLPPEQQQSSDVVGIQGVPLRATPNDRTDNKLAELWFDLIKVRIPPDQAQLTITIRNNPNYLAGDAAPFFTIYGASLVREQR